MSVFISQWEIALVVGLIFGLLVFATILFWTLGKVKPQDDFAELKMRTRSWWLMATIFVFATIVHPVITFISLGLLSFFALRSCLKTPVGRLKGRQATFALSIFHRERRSWS